MKLNRTELKKISYEFNSLANRLLRADFRDYSNVLARFIKYISETEIIYDYILDCGEYNEDLAQAFREVQSRNSIFVLGDSDEEEVRTVYAILKYSVENKHEICMGIGMAYSGATQFQEILKAFNDRVTLILIGHIETYLTKIGIEMGVDDKIIYNISVKNGQVNISNDNSVINATNTYCDAEELLKMIDLIRGEAEKSNFSDSEKEILESSLSVIEEECKEEKPRKAFLNTALVGLNTIKGTVEFTAAVVTLVQFVQQIIQ